MYKSNCKSSEKDIEQSSNNLFDSIFLYFNDENLHIIEEEILNSDLETVLAKKNFFFNSKEKKQIQLQNAQLYSSQNLYNSQHISAQLSHSANLSQSANLSHSSNLSHSTHMSSSQLSAHSSPTKK